MKKNIAIAFMISVFAGLGYLGWIYGGIGRLTFSKWLLRKWNAKAEQQKVKFDYKKMEAELRKLDYEDLELLFRYTWIDPIGKSLPLDPLVEKKVKPIVTKLRERNVFKRADLTVLTSISLFRR